MRAQGLGTTCVLVFNTGDRVIEKLQTYLAEQGVTAGHFTAIGGMRQVELRYFNTQTREYEARQINEQVEVACLTGNVALLDGKPYIHAHIILGDKNYGAYAGHLGEGIVEPTLELFLTRVDGTFTRFKNAQTGLAELHAEPRP